MPRPKPRLAPLFINAVQLLSSLIVAAITSYFLAELHHDHYRLPWTFILLLTTALLTLPPTLATTIPSLPSPPPLLALSINTLLFLLWLTSFTLLTRWTSFSGTLSHACGPQLWSSSLGVTICRLYKALFAFSLFGVLSAAASLVFHIIHWGRNGSSEGGGRSRSRGRFVMLDGKTGGRGAGAQSRGPGQGHGHGIGEAEAESEMHVRQDVVNPNPVAREKYKRFKIGRNRRARGGQLAEYTIPEEQFERYNEEEEEEMTEYRGAASAFGRSDRV